MEGHRHGEVAACAGRHQVPCGGLPTHLLAAERCRCCSGEDAAKANRHSHMSFLCELEVTSQGPQTPAYMCRQCMITL